MSRFLILIIIVFLLYKLINKAKQAKTENDKEFQSKSNSSGREDLVEDPVCHTYIPVSQAYKKEIYGKEYYFCSKQCCDKYNL